MVTKQQAAETIREARFRAGVPWSQLAETIGRPTVWTIAALLGEHPMGAADAAKVGELLDLDESVVRALQLPPYRGSGRQEIPTDPTIYRLYEAMDVYGAGIKELILEGFGDGNMRSLNFTVVLQCLAEPCGVA